MRRAGLLVAVPAAVLLAHTAAGGSTSPRPDPATTQERITLASAADTIAEGEQLFKRTGCVHCHGARGEGGMGPDLTDGEWAYGEEDAEVYRSISVGRPNGMPGWGAKLTEEQIWRLVAYLRSLR